MRKILSFAFAVALAHAPAWAEESSGASSATPVYRWTEDTGRLNFATVPAPDVTDAEVVWIRPVQGTVSGNHAEIQRRVRSYEERIQLLRDARAVKMGISRDTLDRLEPQR